MQNDMLNRQLMDATPDRDFRHLTDKLRESEDRFRGAFEASVVGIALVAPDGRWLEINRALCKIVGYTESELLATNFQSITHPDDLTADLEQLACIAHHAPNEKASTCV